MDTEHRRNLNADDFRSIIAKSVDGFTLVDTSGDFLDVNASYCQMLGYAREELLKMHMSDIDAFESADDVAKRSQEIILNGSLRFETRHLHKDGSTIDVEVSANYSPLYGGSFFSFVRDITQKNLIEKAHRLSEERYRNIVETQTEFVDRYLPGGILTYVNDSLAKFVGVPSEELVGKSFYPFLHEDDREETIRRIELISPENNIMENESRIVLPDGRMRWHRWTSTGIFDEHENLVEYQSVGRDITERKAVTDALRASERRYRSLVETASEGIVVAQGNRLVFINPVIPGLTGYTKEELLAMPFLEFIHPDYRELMKNNYVKRIIGEPIDQRYEIQIVRKDGMYRWVEISGAKIDWEGQPATLNVVTDITERKITEEALQQSEKRFRNLLHDIPAIAVQGYGPDGTTQYWNKASEKLYGFSAEEAIGRNLLDLIIPSEMRSDVEQAMRYMAETGRPIPASELSLKRKDDSLVPVLSSHAIVKAPGREQELFCLDIDLSDQKKADAEKLALEYQLLHAQKMESLGVLAGGIAHDFNNLLAVIIGHCSLAKLRPTTAVENIQPIETAAERAAALCQQMLAYAGKAHISKTQTNFEEMVDEMVKMSKSTISQNVKITFDLASEIPPIIADASQIRQVTMNLIINASEAIGEKQGEVAVSLAKITIRADQHQKDYIGDIIPPGRYACLEVTDNGCGMDAETQQRIFEPFYTTKFTGRGLGMSAVLGIIKAHNGGLQLFSKPGQGTTFKVYLPISISETAQDPSIQLTSPSLPWKGSGTVLLVEDEEQVTLIAKVMLEELGFTVIGASNGKEALEQYQRNAKEISLVVTDIGMPVMDGYALFRELKKLNPDLPIIISSGFGDADVTSRIPSEEVAGMISKPYNFEQLRDVLKDVCG